jgi:hypothetical protein
MQIETISPPPIIGEATAMILICAKYALVFIALIAAVSVVVAI